MAGEKTLGGTGRRGLVDTAEEISIYEAGGVLQRFAEDFFKAVLA